MNGSKLTLDTNIILYLLGGDTTLSSFLQEKEGYISIITELELIGYPEINEKELNNIKRFLEDCIIININDDIKKTYTALRRKYKLKLGDAIVAATAMHLELPLITADKKFNQITELDIMLYNV